MAKRIRRPRVVETPLEDGAYGYCYCRNLALIEMDPRQCGKVQLDTLIHELLHYIEPKRSEQWVRANAAVMADVLWRFGYRRTKSR